MISKKLPEFIHCYFVVKLLKETRFNFLHNYLRKLNRFFIFI